MPAMDREPNSFFQLVLPCHPFTLSLDSRVFVFPSPCLHLRRSYQPPLTQYQPSVYTPDCMCVQASRLPPHTLHPHSPYLCLSHFLGPPKSHPCFLPLPLTLASPTPLHPTPCPCPVHPLLPTFLRHVPSLPSPVFPPTSSLLPTHMSRLSLSSLRLLHPPTFPCRSLSSPAAPRRVFGNTRT